MGACFDRSKGGLWSSESSKVTIVGLREVTEGLSEGEGTQKTSDLRPNSLPNREDGGCVNLEDEGVAQSIGMSSSSNGPKSSKSSV